MKGAGPEPKDDLPDLIEDSQLLRLPAGSPDDWSDPDDTARLPNVIRMPEGIEVVEHKAGRAVGQWVLLVRCQCGRRWFELETIDATTCPRCGLLVYVDVQVRAT